MKRHQFISYMDAPDNLSGEDSFLLAEVVKSFPYFQTAHLLYTKSLHNQHSIHYNNELKITAAFATSRKRLHQLITKKTIAENKPVEAENVTELTSFISAQDTTIQSPVKENNTVIVQDVPIADATETLAEPVIGNVVETIKEFVAAPEKQVDELEKNYLQEVAIAAVELDLATTPLSSVKEEEYPPIEDTNFVLNTPVFSKEAEEPKEEIKEEEEFDAKVPHTFGEWLKHLPSPGITLQQGGAINEERQRQPPPEKKSKKDLIDTFLKEEPRIRPKAEFFNPVQIARQSVADDITFVSETLAKIYLLQENYGKALEAYENLRLKYPEKRLYFATQIKKIRKLINQNK